MRLFFVYNQGPIYEIDRQHNYQDLGPLVDKIKALQGPVYNIDANHHYQQILDHVDNLKSLKGPVYDIDRYALKDYFTTFLQEGHCSMFQKDVFVSKNFTP